MEKNNMNLKKQPLVGMPQHMKTERMDKLFVHAVGDEIVEKRGEMVKHFNMGANRYQAVVYSEPVHFRESEEEVWQEIDNTLEETVNEQGRHVLRNRANRIHVEFPQEMDGGNMAAITDGGKTFTWRFEEEAQPIRAKIRTGAQMKHEQLVKQAQKLPKYVGRTVESLQAADLEHELETEQERRGSIARLQAENTYENVLPGVSVRYTLNSEKVKEDIILADVAALKHAKLRLPKDFDYEVTESKQLLILDKADGKVVFTMNAPYVYDAAGKDTVADVILTDCGAYIRLEYSLEDAFMKEALFPVTIDPTVSSVNAANNIFDTTLGYGQSFTPYAEDHMKVGKYGGSVECVGLLRFKDLAIPTPGNAVVSAVLAVYPKNAPASNYIGAYEIKKSWVQETTNWASLDPTDSANVGTDALDCVTGSTTNWLQFDLTNLYRKWCTRNASGISNNNGVAFRTPKNISGNNYSELYSANAASAYQPVMYVSYINHAGLESQWQFEEMGAGRAGIAHTDLLTGNLVLEHSDTAMSGNRMPVSVTHYYNSVLSGANNYKCGYGWKTSAHQKVTLFNIPFNNSNYFVWEDEDGTEHFFAATGSQPYKDEEGLELELTYNTGSPDYILITDKQHNQMRFNVLRAGYARLAEAKDAVGNAVTYEYVDDNENESCISRIIDPVGRVTQFNYTNGMLASIVIPAANNGSRTVYFTYDSNNRLTGVRYSELGGSTAHTTYSYSGTTNLLVKVRNYDGVQLNIDYEPLSNYITDLTDPARRVSSMETVATSASGTVTKSGAKVLLTYDDMFTKVTAVDSTNGDKSLYYQFNDMGNVTSVRDDLGFGRFTKFDSAIYNKPVAESTLKRVVVNLLQHPDLSADWTVSGSAVKDSTTTCMGVPSAKLTSSASENSVYRQEVTLQPNTKYTFSAYVKVQNVGGNAGAFLKIRKKTDEYNMMVSDGLFGTTTAAPSDGMPTDGWQRISATYDHNSTVAEDFYVEMILFKNAGGTAWFACPQLETGAVMNVVNFITNGDFAHSTLSGSQYLPNDWSKAANTFTTSDTGVKSRSTDPTIPSALSGNYLSIEGSPDRAFVGFVQTLNMAGKSGDLFTLGGWVDSYSIPVNGNTGRHSLLFRVKKTDGTWSGYQDFVFNTERVGWQFGCFAVSAPADYQQVEVTISYINNCNVSKFTNIFLSREAFGQSFAYDSDKNLISTSNLAGQKSDIKYDDAKNVNIYTQPGRDSTVADNQHWFYYGDTPEQRKEHLLWRSRTPMHVTDFYDYDGYGNVKTTCRTNIQALTGSTDNNVSTDYPYIRTENTYAHQGNYPEKAKDARGYEVIQEIDANDGTLTSVSDPTEQTVNYTYDTARRVTGVYSEELDENNDPVRTYRNAYTYENDRIKTVSHNTTSDVTNDVTYTFNYDELGRKTSVQVGTQTLSTNVYEETRSGLLSEVQYGNGGKVKYSYDDFDRMTGVKYDEDLVDRYTYEYGANGKVAEVYDQNEFRIARTAYDLAERPCQTEMLMEAESGRHLLYRTRLQYDKLNNLQKFSEEIGSPTPQSGIQNIVETHQSEYAYDRDNRITQITYDGGAHKVGYTYDNLGRVVTRVAENGSDAGKVTSSYGYVDGGYGANSTTPLVASIAQKGISFAYTYDSRGNITSETRTDASGNSLTTNYLYDVLGQLVRVNDPHENATWVYNYDRGGNITSKVRYLYTTDNLGWPQETIPYVYGDSNWKDKLTSYNNRSFTYDAIGNTVSDGVWSYTWEAGRRLQSMSSGDTTLSFKYDHNGLRTQKEVTKNGTTVTSDYVLHGKLITHMTVGSDKLHFFYDAQSRPAKVNFNGEMYVYVLNLQGDIVGILDKDGNLVVEYKYDAWGKPLSTTGNMAATLGKCNPFRYRGYVYDEEIGLYYLRSRYYSSQFNRFLIPDLSMRLFGDTRNANLYMYCKNNPTLFNDLDGKTSALATLVIAAALVVTAVVVGAIMYTARKSTPSTPTSESAKKHLNSLMGEGYIGETKGRFSGSIGYGKITTAEMNFRNNAIAVVDALLAHYITKNVFDLVDVLSNLSSGLGYCAAGGTALIESPLESMYSLRDGEYTYYNYTWYTTISIFGWDLEVGSTTYTVYDYGQGYVEVWMSTTDYIFQENSTAPAKIKSGEII